MPEPPHLTEAERDELVAYLDGELDATQLQRVEERLSLDPHVRAEADALKRTWELLDFLPQAQPSPEFTSRTVTAIAALRPAAAPPPRLPDWARSAGWAAVLIAALLAGYVIPGRSPPPQPAPELEADPLFVQQPRVIEHLPLYLAADNLDYLLALGDPELFGDETMGR